MYSMCTIRTKKKKERRAGAVPRLAVAEPESRVMMMVWLRKSPPRRLDWEVV